MKRFVLCGWVAVFLTGFQGEAASATLYVDIDGTHAVAPFTSWATAATNIQMAVDAAVAGDTVLVTEGHYLLASEVLVTNAITIQSVNGAAATIVDGGGSTRCFNLGGTASFLSGFTLTNGYSAVNGGGVYCEDVVPVVSNCVFTGNSAHGGGGMRFGTANDCVFERNSSAVGGGMYGGLANRCVFRNNSAVYDISMERGNGGGMHSGTANYCQFIGNSADSVVNYYALGNGGGLFNGIANHCEFIGNSAAYSGGGMYAMGSGILSTASNSTFIGNSAQERGGGAGGLYSQNMTLFNCTLSGNTALSGGGIDTATANNCTITGNSADFGGGMVGSYSSVVNNCVIWGNTANAATNLYKGGPTKYTCSPDVEHGVDGNITNAPMLVSASHISTNSPCRGAGSAAYAMGVDIDGEAWLNPPSMGCDEIDGTIGGAIFLSIIGPAQIAAGYSGKYLVDIRGAVMGNVLDFGDGTLLTNATLASHTWDVSGDYTMVLSAFNEDYPSGVFFTQTVQVVSAETTAIYVSESTGSDASDGLDWATAKKSIQSGVDAQQVHGGLVWVSNGLYAVAAEITVTNDIRIQSVHGTAVTIVDGGDSNRCFNLGNSACVLSGFTITNGHAFDHGGGILCYTASPVITNCTISGNMTEGTGGGISRGRVNNSTIVGNSVIRRKATGSGGYGGGMYVGIVNDCTIRDNSAESSGGGMYYGRAFNCMIISNSTASDGGGIYSVTANNSMLIGNSAQNMGGGMYDGTANNCTITGNSAQNGGGCASGRRDGILNNSIVWGNFSIYGGNEIDGFSSYNSCSANLVPDVNGNITNAPLFVDAANGNYRLSPTSPCINWGNNADVSGVTDLADNPRIIENYVDMGCYEYQSLIGEADNDNDGISDAWERLWFGQHVLPDGNPDGDGSPNKDEYVAGTNPTNAASFFQMSAEASEVGFIIDWTSVSGRVYNVYWKPSLKEDFQPLETGLLYPQSSYTDTVHSAEASGFYRIVVMRADYDADGDGLPNDWEAQYAVDDAFADGDLDGFNNLAEFISGTDPTHGSSYFATENSLTEINGTNYFVVEWISVPDRLYSVQWSTNLVSGFQVLEAGLEYPQTSYTDTLHSAESVGFYNVKVGLK